jgi:hypothetical protein
MYIQQNYLPLTRLSPGETELIVGSIPCRKTAVDIINEKTIYRPPLVSSCPIKRGVYLSPDFNHVVVKPVTSLVERHLK